MAAAGIDLVPLVERGSGWLEHDQKLLLEAKSTQARGWVEAAGPAQYLPGDSEGGPLVLQLPHVIRESGAGLVPVPEVALMLSNPVPEWCRW